MTHVSRVQNPDICLIDQRLPKSGNADSEIYYSVAGSETTATTLSGTTNYLLRNPDVLKRLTQEVRQKYNSESEMTFASLSQTPYLTAIVEEGLRVCPPVPGGAPRVVPRGGANVCGEHIPGNVSTFLPNMSPLNLSLHGEAKTTNHIDYSLLPHAIRPSVPQELY